MSAAFLSHGGALLLLIRKSANTCIHVIWMYYDAFETYKCFIVVTGLTLLFFLIPLFQFGSCFSSRRPLLLFEGCGNTFMCKTIQCGPVSFRVALCVTSRSAVQPYSLSSMKQVQSINSLLASRWFQVMWEPKAAATDSLQPDNKFETALETTNTLLGSSESVPRFLLSPPFQPLQVKPRRILTDWLTREGCALVVGTINPRQTEKFPFKTQTKLKWVWNGTEILTMTSAQRIFSWVFQQWYFYSS